MKPIRHVVLGIGLNIINALSAYLLGLTASLILVGFDASFILSRLLPRLHLYRLLFWLFYTPCPHLLLVTMSLAFFLCIQRLTKIPFKRPIGILFLLMGIGTTILILIAFILSTVSEFG